MNEKELLCRLALPLLPGIGLVSARHLIQAAGSAAMLLNIPANCQPSSPACRPR